MESPPRRRAPSGTSAERSPARAPLSSTDARADTGARPADTGARPWDARATWCLVALVAGALGSLPWWWHGFLDPKNDACMYIVLARNLLAGEGYTLLGEPFALRPPGFALLLAPFIAAFGTDLGLLNLLVNLFGVVGVALLFVLVRPRLGSALALALSSLVWANPGFRSSCNQVMSDVPGITLALGCLVLERTWRGRGPRLGLGLGLAIGLSALVRTMNLLIAPAVLLALFLSREGRAQPARRRVARALWLVLGTAAAVAPWAWRNARIELPAPTEQTSIYSYGTGMLHADPADPSSPRLATGEVLGRIPRQLARVTHSLGSRFRDEDGPVSRPRGPARWFGALALAALVGVALARREPTELFALGLTAVVSVYFAFVDRLALPVFVLTLPATAEVLRLALGRLGSARLATGVVGSAILALTLVDAAHPSAAERLGERERRVLALVDFLEARLPPGAPLAVRNGWELSVYMPERSVYNLYVVAKARGRAGMLTMLERHGIDHCLFHQPTPDDRPLRQALRGVFERSAGFDGWSLLERRR